MTELRKLLELFHIETSNINLYEQAFTHSSYVNEKKTNKPCYERLEFIGDGVLDLIIADFVYKQYPDLDQGQLSKLRIYFVNGEALTRYAKKYNFNNILLLGHGQKINGGTNDKILEDVFEAFIGAVYLDKGFDFVYKLIQKIFLEDIQNVSLSVLKDYKSQLQEYVQADSRNSVQYRCVSETGNPPNTEFVCEVYWDDTVFGVGKGTSKKKAEQEAAKDALSKMVR